MNLPAIAAIYKFEMARWGRTFLQSIVSPVVATSLYFVVFGAAIGARITEIPVRHHPRRFGQSKYGLSRVWKVLADLLTLSMIRWFGERPLAMFAWWASASATGAITFLIATLVLAPNSGSGAPNTVVFQGIAVLLFGLAGYLLILGLISEVALYGDRALRNTGRRLLKPE